MSIRQSRVSLMVVTLIIICLGIHSCATNPVTGKREFNLLGESDEIQLGKQSDPAITAQYGLYDDPEIAKFINDLGQKMAAVSHRPHLEWHFRVLDSPVVNAFALPGGYTYVTRGILAYMNSEAELAGVLGHEIGHVTARHGAAAYTRQQLAQVGLTAGFAFSETFRQFGQLAQFGVGALFLKFSRDQESQSDRLGVDYSTAIGYDARDMSHFFGTLSRLSDKGGQALPGWLSTHPDPEDREAKTLELAKAAQASSARTAFETERDKYLAMIDGIVYGEDPRQGFFENGYFYHPGLDFQFPVPEGWQVMNTPQVVFLASEERQGIIQFSLASEQNAGSAAQKFVSDNQAQVVDSRSTTTNGLKTETVVTLVTTQDGQVKVLSYFIEKETHVYVFHGITTPASYQDLAGTFRNTMSNFDRLRNQQAKNKKPNRIDIVRVTQSVSAKAFLDGYATDKVTIDELAIINGLQLTDTLNAGSKVKIVKAE